MVYLCIILSDLAKFSATQSVAWNIWDRWAFCNYRISHGSNL